MKKFIIAATAITLSICLAGCGNSAQESSLNALSNQLDTTSNAVSSMNTASPTLISTKSENLQDVSRKTQDALLNEQYYRAEILEKTAKIKNCLAKDVKISKTQASALRDLTMGLDKYTNSINSTKSEMTSNAKAFSALKADAHKNKEKLNAKLNRLACNSNVRSAYYENIINTLDEIEKVVAGECNKIAEQPAVEEKREVKTETETSQQNESQTPKRKLKKNIDTYRFEDDNTVPQRRAPRGNVYNRYNRFNPTRNTDTYGPNYRNIDSYGGINRFNQPYGAPYGANGVYGGNGYYGAPYARPNYGYTSNDFNRLNAPMYDGAIPVQNEKKDEKEPEQNTVLKENKPEQRLETFEKVAEDKTIEKVENDASIKAVSLEKVTKDEDKIVRAH